MEISKKTLFPLLIFNKPFQYNEQIIFSPVTMKDIVFFQTLSESITIRKNSVFREKKIIKMSYLEFLIYSYGNKDLEEQYKMPGLSEFILYAIQLLKLCCKGSEIEITEGFGQIFMNGVLITSEIFDDLRKIIIIQNDIDFDIDEFINYDTETRLKDAENKQSRDKPKVNIEDYIDSLVIAMNVTEDKIMDMTIRKFWRYIKRYQLHENYTIAKTGECSGLVKYKEPISHWMVSLEEDDKYKNLKTDESELRSKISE